MRKTVTKLSLSRNTVRVLGELELVRATGAMRPDGSDRDNTCDYTNCGPSTPYVGCTL